MKRVIIVALLLLPVISVSGVNAQENPFQLYDPEIEHIHPGSNSTITLKWWNLISEDRTITIEENETPDGFSLTGVPFTRGTGAGLYGETWLKIHVNQTMSYGTYSFNLSVSCTEITEWEDSLKVTIEVARPSELAFGVESSSTYTVNPGVRFGVKVNLTNNAQWHDNATLSLDSISGWNTGWNMDEITDENAILSLDTDQVEWVNLWIEIPEVVNSVPRSGTGPSFTLSAQSELDKRFIRWEFTIEVGVFKNATLNSVEESAKLGPGGRSWLNVSFNNNGNHDTTYDIDLRQVNPDGSPISGAERGNLLSIDGWKVGLFKHFETNVLKRAEDRIFEVSFEAPMVESAEIWVEVIISPKGAEQRSISTIVNAKIHLQHSAELTLGDDCNRINTTTGCILEIALLNTGNFNSDFLIEVQPSSDFKESNQNFSLNLGSGESSSTITVDLSTKEEILAFTRGDITVLAKNSTGVILAQDSIEYVIEPIISWEWERAESQIDHYDNLSILITIRNNGNAIDGITVRMQTNVYTEQGFIPPDGAVIQEGVENPRSFEVHNVPLRANYSFRAWIHLPDDQQAAGELFVNLSIQSQYSSGETFKHTVRENYSAKKSVPKEEGVIDGLSEVVDTARMFIAGWWHVFAAIILSGLILNKAINDRLKRKEEEPIQLPPKQPETVEDWQAGFQPGAHHEEVDLSSPVIDRESFASQFRSKASPKPKSQGVSQELVGAATTVLDHHDEQAMMQKMDHLADDILSVPSQPHQANVTLPKAQAITERTNPQKRQDDLDI